MLVVCKRWPYTAEESVLVFASVPKAWQATCVPPCQAVIPALVNEVYASSTRRCVWMTPAKNNLCSVSSDGRLLFIGPGDDHIVAWIIGCGLVRAWVTLYPEHCFENGHGLGGVPYLQGREGGDGVASIMYVIGGWTQEESVVSGRCGLRRVWPQGLECGLHS